MSQICEVCGKTTTFGHNVSFSKRRTNRMYKANIQRKWLIIDGERTRKKICTRCVRTTYKAGKA